MSHPPWDAPRAAYLLTAAMAGSAPRSGPVVPGDDIGAEWAGYDQSTRQDILAALGAQTRLALRMLRDKLGLEIEMDSGGAARIACARALAAARDLIYPPEGVPRAAVAPECPRCTETIARALCSLQIQAYSRMGFTPAMIAATCRQAGRKAGTAPRR